MIIGWILGFILGSIIILFWLFYQKNYSKFFSSKNPKLNTSEYKESFSIVICYKGYNEHFFQYISKILIIPYSNFEVILCYDSIPEKELVKLYNLSVEFSNLKLIDVNSYPSIYPTKKNALNIGINQAQYPWIITTDADCMLRQDDWLTQFNSCIQLNNSDIILGFSPSNLGSTWLSDWSRYDSILVASKYLSSTYLYRPYMGVGRNMAFKKSLWTAEYLQKYKSMGHGDDTTLVQFYQKTKIISPCATPPIFTRAPHKWSQWFKQKIRHISTGGTMPNNTKSFLAREPLLTVLFWIIAWYWISYEAFHFSIIILWLLYLILKMNMYRKIENRLSMKKKVFWYLPIFDFPYNFCLLIFPFISKIYKPKWN